MNDTPKQGGRNGRPSDDELMNSVPGAKGGREARVGIFVLGGLLSFVIVLFLLTDPATFRGRYKVVTTVPDAGGIRRGDPIQMQGVNIGRIHAFELGETGDVAITLEVEGEWKIPVDSRSRLGASGIFGGRTMEILQGESDTILQPWDTIPGSDEGGGIMGSAEELTDQADVVLQRLRTLLDEETVSSVQGGATELEGVLTQLSAVITEQRSTLRSLTESLSRSAEGLEAAAAAGPDAARAIARADSAMAVLAQTGTNVDAAVASLRTLLDRMERGEGTLGRLSQDSALYENLNRAAESTALLVEDIRANPGKYISVSIF